MLTASVCVWLKKIKIKNSKASIVRSEKESLDMESMTKADVSLIKIS